MSPMRRGFSWNCLGLAIELPQLNCWMEALGTTILTCDGKLINGQRARVRVI